MNPAGYSATPDAAAITSVTTMTIYNTTFIVERADQARFISFLRDEAMPLLVDGRPKPCGLRVMRLTEVPGQPADGEMPASIALQCEFDNAADATAWAATSLAGVIEGFRASFGPEAVAFPTVLETVEL